MCYNENKGGYVVKKNGCTCSDNENKGGYVVKKNGCTWSDNCFNTHYGMMGTSMMIVEMKKLLRYFSYKGSLIKTK